MKISPLSGGANAPGQAIGAVDVGRTADPIKLERARQIARGEVPQETTGDPQADRVRQNVRSIKMRTQQSTNYAEPIEELVTEEATPVSSIPESNEEATVEVTQPLSPQFAALAKQKRALQVKERELQDREKALASKSTTEGDPDLIARLKSQPLRVLQEHGVTYDQLTEAILSDQNGGSHEIQALKEEIRALKEGVDKTLTDRDVQAEQAALNEMRKEATRLSLEGEAFELVRETKSIPQVIDLIHRTYKETGEVMDVQEAMQLIEDELITESLKLATLKKVQGRIPQPQAQAPLQPQQRQMKTLTARDTAAPSMSRKARAIAAMNGTLNKR